MESNDPKTNPPNDIAAGVANVVDAALDLGVSLARVVAESTALGRTVPPVAAGTPALTFDVLAYLMLDGIENAIPVLAFDGEFEYFFHESHCPTGAPWIGHNAKG